MDDGTTVDAGTGYGNNANPFMMQVINQQQTQANNAMQQQKQQAMAAALGATTQGTRANPWGGLTAGLGNAVQIYARQQQALKNQPDTLGQMIQANNQWGNAAPPPNSTFGQQAPAQGLGQGQGYGQAQGFGQAQSFGNPGQQGPQSQQQTPGFGAINGTAGQGVFGQGGFGAPPVDPNAGMTVIPPTVQPWGGADGS